MNAKTDSIRTVSRGARLFLSGTLFSRVSGLARDLVMASIFGSAPAVAAFLMAFRFSHLPRRLFGEGAMHSAFIPHFEELRLTDSVRAANLYRHLSLSIGFLLATLLLLGEVGVLAGMYWGHPSVESLQVLKLTAIMLPVLFFVCLYGMNSALLNCGEVFFLPSVAPALLNIAWIGGTLLLSRLPVSTAMLYLSGVIVLGGAAQWCITLPSVCRVLRELSGGLKTSYRAFWRSSDLKRVLQPLCLGILGVGAAQINSALDPIFARIADPQGPAFLWYAIRLQQLPLALFGIALARVLLPALSRAVKEGNDTHARELLVFAVRRGAALMLPFAFGITVAGVATVNLVYGRGQFDLRATYETTYCLWAYGWGLLPMTLIMILAAPLYAAGDYRTPALAGTLAVVCNAGLNAFFVFVLGWGAVSVAVATTVASVGQVGMLAWALKRHKHAIQTAAWWSEVVRVTIACSVAATLTWLFFLPRGGELSRDFWEQLTQFGMEGACFGGLLLLGAWVVKARDLLAILPARGR